MPEILQNGFAPRIGLMWLLGWAVSLCAFASFASADSLPPSVRSCAAEADPGRRLACFDKEVARFPEALPTVGTKRETTAGSGANNTVGEARSDTNSNDRPTATQNPSGLSEDKQTTQGSSARTEPRHVTARVVSVAGSQDKMVLHLDNGQVWEQVQEATADMNLRAGSAITIDKSLGSYWLGGRSAGVMKVRQIKQK